MESQFNVVIPLEEDQLVGRVKQHFSQDNVMLGGKFSFQEPQKALDFIADLLRKTHWPDEFHPDPARRLPCNNDETKEN